MSNCIICSNNMHKHTKPYFVFRTESFNLRGIAHKTCALKWFPDYSYPDGEWGLPGAQFHVWAMNKRWERWSDRSLYALMLITSSEERRQLLFSRWQEGALQMTRAEAEAVQTLYEEWERDFQERKDDQHA